MPLNAKDFDNVKEMLKFANGFAARSYLVMPEPQHLTDEQILTLNDGTNPASNFRVDLAGDGVGGGATAINVSGITTKAALATAVANAINSIAGGLTVQGTAEGDMVNLLNSAVGAAGNQAIVESGGSVTFAQGRNMTGGATAVTPVGDFHPREVGGRWWLFWMT